MSRQSTVNPFGDNVSIDRQRRSWVRKSPRKAVDDAVSESSPGVLAFSLEPAKIYLSNPKSKTRIAIPFTDNTRRRSKDKEQRLSERLSERSNSSRAPPVPQTPHRGSGESLGLAPAQQLQHTSQMNGPGFQGAYQPPASLHPNDQYQSPADHLEVQGTYAYQAPSHVHEWIDNLHPNPATAADGVGPDIVSNMSAKGQIPTTMLQSEIRDHGADHLPNSHCVPRNARANADFEVDQKIDISTMNTARIDARHSQPVPSTVTVLSSHSHNIDVVVALMLKTIHKIYTPVSATIARSEEGTMASSTLIHVTIALILETIDRLLIVTATIARGIGTTMNSTLQLCRAGGSLDIVKIGGIGISRTPRRFSTTDVADAESC
ncbi:MAG: hypothetical protein Q9191_004054 [Dirinaria sp. TL-2023a]